MKEFIECKTVEEANSIDREQYRFLENFSAKRGTYCFSKYKNLREEVE